MRVECQDTGALHPAHTEVLAGIVTPVVRHLDLGITVSICQLFWRLSLSWQRAIAPDQHARKTYGITTRKRITVTYLWNHRSHHLSLYSFPLSSRLKTSTSSSSSLFAWKQSKSLSHHRSSPTHRTAHRTPTGSTAFTDSVLGVLNCFFCLSFFIVFFVCRLCRINWLSFDHTLIKPSLIWFD